MNNLTILISGSGTNLQRIIDAINSGEIENAQINLVIADRDCHGLQRAENVEINNLKILRDKNFSQNLDKSIPENTDLIILAGFLSILSKEFCEKYEGKIINIHPSLLPKFGGKGMWGHHVHHAVLDSGEKESGATVHFVTSGVDEGKIILQKSFPVEEGDTVEILQKKVHGIEQEIFPKAINLILNKEIPKE